MKVPRDKSDLYAKIKEGLEREIVEGKKSNTKRIIYIIENQKNMQQKKNYLQKMESYSFTMISMIPF